MYSVLEFIEGASKTEMRSSFCILFGGVSLQLISFLAKNATYIEAFLKKKCVGILVYVCTRYDTLYITKSDVNYYYILQTYHIFGSIIDLKPRSP